MYTYTTERASLRAYIHMCVYYNIIHERVNYIVQTITVLHLIDVNHPFIASVSVIFTPLCN